MCGCACPGVRYSQCCNLSLLLAVLQPIIAHVSVGGSMPEDSKGRAGGLTLDGYLRVLWRWKWMIVIIVLASTGSAYFYSWRQAPQYMATASLLYVEPVDPSNPLG